MSDTSELTTCLPPEWNVNIGGRAPTVAELDADCSNNVSPFALGAWIATRGLSEGGVIRADPACTCGVSRRQAFGGPACDMPCPEVVIPVLPSPGPVLSLEDIKDGTVFSTPPPDRPVCRVPGSDPPVPVPEGAMASFITPESTGVVTSGTADILINGSTHTTAVHGEVTFPGLPCPGSSCEVNMAFDLTADNVGVGDFLGIAGVSLEDLDVGGAGTPGQLVLGPDGRGTYPADTVQAWGRGSAVERVFDIEISRTTSGFLLSTNEPVDVHVNWTAATFSVEGEFSLPAGDDPVMDPAFTVRLSLTGTLTNQPPTARVAATPTQECTGPDGAEVTLDASGSFDPDGPIPLFSWRRGVSLREPNLLDPDVGTAPIVTVRQAAGTTETYTVLVGDGLGNYDEAETTASVVDTTAPSIDAVTLAHDCLWPPNHKFVRFELGDEILAEVTDACDDAVAIRVVGVTSSEPDDGRGDGSTVPDVLFGETGFCLRSERAGVGTGRVYTVTLEAEDSSGNRSSTDVQVRVPHESEPGCRLEPSELLSDPEAVAECSFPAVPLAVEASRPPEVVRVDDPRPPPSAGRPASCSASPTSRAPLGLALVAILALVLPRRRRPSR